MKDINLSNLFSSNDSLHSLIQALKKKPQRFLSYSLLPKHIKQQLTQTADLRQQNHVANCWRAMIELYQQNKLNHYHLQAKQTFNHHKIIWQYWGQGIDDNLPNVVKVCFASVDNHAGDYQVIRLDDNNISQYLDLPDFVFTKRQNPKFKPAFFADLLRLALLSVYGGVWLDATVLLTAPLDNTCTQANFCVYERQSSADNQERWQNFNTGYFSWHSEHKINVLNSILFAKPQQKIIDVCLTLLLNYWETQDNVPHYFFFQIMFNEVLRNNLVAKDYLSLGDTKPHELIYALQHQYPIEQIQKIMQEIHIHKLTYNIKNDIELIKPQDIA